MQVRGGGKAVALYAELATLLQAEQDRGRLRHRGGRHQHRAAAGAAELKPGLNFVARLGSRGQTGYLIGNELTVKLPTERSGPEPKVAVMLGPLAFDPGNKAAAIGVLRHELEHALHDRLAANLLKRWREDAGAEKTPFAAWLEKQSISAVERALVRERIPGSNTNTEALAHLEGFIAGFAVEAPDVKEGSHRVYENELKEAAPYWAGLREGGAGRVHHAAEGVQGAAEGRAAEHADRGPEGPQGRRQGLRALGRRRPRLSARALAARRTRAGGREAPARNAGPALLRPAPGGGRPEGRDRVDVHGARGRDVRRRPGRGGVGGRVGRSHARVRRVPLGAGVRGAAGPAQGRARRAELRRARAAAGRVGVRAGVGGADGLAARSPRSNVGTFVGLLICLACGALHTVRSPARNAPTSARSTSS